MNPRPVICHLRRRPSAVTAHLDAWLGTSCDIRTFDTGEALPDTCKEALLYILEAETLTPGQLAFFGTDAAENIPLVLVTAAPDPDGLRRLMFSRQVIWIAPDAWKAESVRTELSALLERSERQRRYDEALQLRSRRAALCDAVGSIAHQWRQPISLISTEAINLSLHAQLNTLDNEMTAQSADLIGEQTQKMSRVMSSFLSMNRAVRLKERFCIDDVFHSLEDFFAPQLQQSDIVLTFETCGEDTGIYGYRVDLEEVLMNLISNARDAYRQREEVEERTITLRAVADERQLHITVSDNAGGVPRELRQRIFDPHFSTKKEGEGFGIGLYIARMTVEKEFSGTLTLHVREKGSDFDIVLPRTETAEEQLVVR